AGFGIGSLGLGHGPKARRRGLRPPRVEEGAESQTEPRYGAQNFAWIPKKPSHGSIMRASVKKIDTSHIDISGVFCRSRLCSVKALEESQCPAPFAPSISSLHSALSPVCMWARSFLWSIPAT